MLEVFRQKILREFWGIPDNKAIVAFAPGHYGFSGSIINHVIGLCKKRRRCIALQSIHRVRPSRGGTTCWKQRDLGIHHHDLSRNHLLSDLFFPSSMFAPFSCYVCFPFASSTAQKKLAPLLKDATKNDRKNAIFHHLTPSSLSVCNKSS